MTIKTFQSEDQLTLVIAGRVDTTTSPELEEEISKSIDDIKNLTLDFSDVEYISSAGLRVLLSTQKKMNRQGNMKVVHCNSTVLDVFEVTGFKDIRTIE